MAFGRSGQGQGALGTGLKGLGLYRTPGPELARAVAAEPPPAAGLVTVRAADLIPNPSNPRKGYAEEEMAELRRSLANDGLQQPLSVRRSGDRFMIICGHRRWLAISMLIANPEPDAPVVWTAETPIPCLLVDAPADGDLRRMFAENEQRAALTPIETGRTLEAIRQQFEEQTGQKLTAAELGARIGKSAAFVTRHLRLLELPPEVEAALADGSISMDSALSLYTAPPALRLEALALITARAAGWTSRDQVAASLNRLAMTRAGVAEPEPAAPDSPRTPIITPPAPSAAPIKRDTRGRPARGPGAKTRLTNVIRVIDTAVSEDWPPGRLRSAAYEAAGLKQPTA